MLQKTSSRATLVSSLRLNLRNYALLAVITASALTGCQQKGAKVANITGTVTHAGKPLANVMVYFTPDSGRPSSGPTDAQGRYSQMYYTKSKSGAVIGKHTVHVMYITPMASVGDEKSIGSKNAPAEWRDVPEKFKTNETSPLKVDVQTEGQVIDLQLD